MPMQVSLVVVVFHFALESHLMFPSRRHFQAFVLVLQEEKVKFVCITNYKAKAPGEVSANEGDTIEVLDNIGSESSMVCVITTGAVGWLPWVFIMRAPEEDVKKAPKTAKGKEREALHQRE